MPQSETSEDQERSEKSEWSVIRLAVKFLTAWEKVGGTKTDINLLAQNLTRLRQIVWMLRGSWELKPKQFPTWYTARLGRYKNMDAFYQRVREVRPKAGDVDVASYFEVYDRLMLKKVAWWQTEIDEDLVLVLDTDLGLAEQTYGYKRLLEMAATVGLYECQQETAAVLMEDFDQVGPTIPWDSVRRPYFHTEISRSPELNIAMRPINLYGNSILTLTKHGNAAKRPTDYFYTGSHWILSRRKPVGTRD